MCGRFNNHLPKMIGWADMLNNWPDVPSSYNVAPSSQIAAFVPQEGGVFSGEAMRWGMIPGWSKTFDSKYATFNARLESVFEKPTFRSAWRNQQRCLIPMAGYYEWKVMEGAKQPFYINDPNVGGLVAAGLYENWSDTVIDKQSCTVITRAADASLEPIHARMPVMLKVEDAEQWMNIDAAEAGEFLAQMETPDVVYWPVSKAVGNTRNNSPELINAIDTKSD